ncbi:conserved protein of unknown function [Magnetospirillum sp. XM-1]|uniref:hypothetical protein n=1 Tax=Magnetospirillum sp. XM-1 TaxID=1663591 RepID=UPI00073DE60D|nr:hypothetical protein [Magnetospirillum sp. XM-1]CUW37451.1 conserved protein of unknown function [Magnetospirillum sp. XM-1]
MSGFEAMVPLIASTAMSVAGQVSKNSAAEDAAQAQAEAQDRQNQYIYQQQEREQRQQRNLLEQASATQRARMGALGVGNGGSANAILSGMAEDTARSILDSSQAAQARYGRAASRRFQAGGGNLLDSVLKPANVLSVFTSFYGSGDASDMNDGGNDFMGI